MKRQKKESRIRDCLLQLIPKHVPAGLVLAGYSLCTHVGRISKKTAKEHLEHNQRLWEMRKDSVLQRSADGRLYLERQALLGEASGAEAFHFGVKDRHHTPLFADYNSCEAIAVFNLEQFLSGEAQTGDFPKLLYTFERNAAACGGRFGSAPSAVERYLKKSGLQVGKLVGTACDRNRLLAFTAQFEAFIVVVYNNKNTLRAGIHTMCVTKDVRNRTTGYLLHNDYHCYGARWYPSLTAAIEDYNFDRAKMIEVLGVKKK